LALQSPRITNLSDQWKPRKIWDKALIDFKGNNTPVETLGVLRDGKELFISAKIDTINVRGDEVQMFQVLYNPMYSNTAAETLITGVRPVCANTLALGMSSAVSKARNPA